MNKFHEYREGLYKELEKFHTWNDDTRTEIMEILQSRNITTAEGMMKVVFDYAFKCGIKQAIDKLVK